MLFIEKVMLNRIIYFCDECIHIYECKKVLLESYSVYLFKYAF